MYNISSVFFHFFLEAPLSFEKNKETVEILTVILFFQCCVSICGSHVKLKADTFLKAYKEMKLCFKGIIRL